MYKYKLEHRFLTTIESITHPKGWLPSYIFSAKWLDDSHIQIGLNFDLITAPEKCTFYLYGTKKNQKYVVISRWSCNLTRAETLKHKIIDKAVELIQKSKDLRANHRKILKLNGLSKMLQGLEFDSDYRITEESESYLKLVYQDAYTKETVSLNRDLNLFNVQVFDLMIDLIQFDEEIISPYSCHDCDDSCAMFQKTNKECSITDKDTKREIDSYDTVKPIWIQGNRRNIVLRNVVFEERCIIDIPHHHLYKGSRIEIGNTTDKDLILNAIRCRDLLRDIWGNVQTR